jgi:hypothetical protein
MISVASGKTVLPRRLTGVEKRVSTFTVLVALVALLKRPESALPTIVSSGLTGPEPKSNFF